MCGMAFLLFVIIVIIDYFVGQVKSQLFARHAHYVVVINGAIEKIFKLLDLVFVFLDLLFKCFLFLLKLAELHKSRYENGY